MLSFYKKILTANLIFLIAVCINPFKVTAQEINLTSLTPVFSTQRTGKLIISKGPDGKKLQIGGRKLKWGLSTYPFSEAIYMLDGKYERFDAWVGIQSAPTQPDKGKVIFQVFGDGNKIYDSGIMTAETPAKRLQVDVKGIKELELFVYDGETGDEPRKSKNNAVVNWGEPFLLPAKNHLPVKSSKPAYEIQGGNHTIIKLNSDGKIVGLSSAKRNIALTGESKLAQCKEIKLSAVQKLPGGGMSFTHLAEDRNGNKCSVTDRFTPTKTSVRWDVDIYSAGKPWTAAIITSIKWPVTKDTKFWTSWSHPDLIGQGYNNDTLKTQWADPLQTRPFTNSSRWLGGNPLMNVPASGDVFSVPLGTVINQQAGYGFSLVQSPQDSLIYMKLVTTADGSIEFQRRYSRLGGGKHVRFGVDLVSHAADWRSGLDWMVKRYPGYFESGNPKAYEIGGEGAYSSWEGELDADKLKKMGFRMNWKASFDFPYMGMFLPPVDHWQTFATSEEARKDPGAIHPYKGGPTSIKQLEGYSKRMRDYGFHVLNYFNVTEFGAHVKGPESVHKNVKEEDLWKDCNDFLHTKIEDGILHDESGSDDYYRTWGQAIVMDPGAKDYQDFLVGQVQRHIDALPSSSGICIDRMDWLRYFNTRADDGISWYRDKPARSLFTSWKSIMSRIIPLMHKNDKVVFVNPCSSMRLDLMLHTDGIYSEHNEFGPGLNSSVFLGLSKPVLAWTASETSLQPDPNYYFQRFLYLGVFPSAPVPDNNHEIKPSAFADKWYLDYGGLFNAMIGRKWLLKPNSVKVTGGNAKVNIFRVPGGYSIPVVLAGQGLAQAKLELSAALSPSADTFLIDALQPGVEQPVAVRSYKDANGKLILEVPLHQGCAVVRLRSKGK